EHGLDQQHGHREHLAVRGGSGTGSAKWLEIVTPNLGRASLILPSCIRTCSTDALSTAGRWITDTLLEAAAVAEGEGMAHRRARACGASRAAADPWRSGCRRPWGGVARRRAPCRRSARRLPGRRP